MRIYYWKSATGSTDLLADHDRSINDLLNGDYSPHDLEKLRTGSSYPIYSFRLNRCDRLLFTTHKNCLHVLEFVPNHNYQKSRILKHGLSDADFTGLLKDETLPAFERDEAVNEAIPLEYYNQQFISLNEEQEEAATIKLPAVVLGGAGTGKTLVALSRLSHSMDAGQKLLYVSQTKLLVDEMQQQWRDGFVVTDGCEVEFKTYDTFCSDLGKIVGDSEFHTWFALQGKADRSTQITLNAESSYAECCTCSGFSLEDYLQLGARQSRVDVRARAYFYNKIFTSYCNNLKAQGQFDPSLSLVPGAEPAYNVIVVDEAQNLSLGQLRQLGRMSIGHAVLYCMDSQQNLSTGHPVRELLTQSFHRKGIELNLLRLNTTHRYTQSVAMALDNIKSMARTIQAGCLDKEEAVSISLAANDIGTFQCLRDSIALPDFVRDRARSTEFAVITLAEFREEAIAKFNTQLVLTPEESIGQEFHTVVVFKLMSDDGSRAIIGKFLPKFAGTKSATVHLPKEKNTPLDPSIQTWINQFYVACSRAKNSLIIMQTLVGRESCILSGFSAKGAIESVLLETDWSAAEAIQRRRGNAEVAARIAANNLPAVQASSPTKKPVQNVENMNKFDLAVGREAWKRTISGKEDKKLLQLLANPKLDVNQRYEEFQSTLLMLACEKGNNSVVRLLLENERIDANLSRPDGGTALIVACALGHDSVVKMLLEHCGDKLEVNFSRRGQVTPLMQACGNGHHLVVKTLLEQCGARLEVNLSAPDGITALMLACHGGHHLVVKTLLTHQKIEVNWQSSSVTPLMIACEKGHDLVVKALLKHERIEVNRQTEGFTALIVACQNGHDSVVKALLKKCGHSLALNTTDTKGKTALWYACTASAFECMDTLLSHHTCLTEATEYLFFKATEEYARTFMVKMLNKKLSMFDILTGVDSLSFRSEQAVRCFDENIRGKSEHPINRILRSKPTADIFFSDSRNLVDELASYMDGLRKPLFGYDL